MGNPGRTMAAALQERCPSDDLGPPRRRTVTPRTVTLMDLPLGFQVWVAAAAWTPNVVAGQTDATSRAPVGTTRGARGAETTMAVILCSILGAPMATVGAAEEGPMVGSTGG